MLPLLATTVHAADWRISPSVTVGETYNDNVNLVAKGQGPQSDFITTISPAVDVKATGKRLNLDFNYSPQEEIFARGTARNNLAQRLLGTGTAEVYPEAFFLEGNASVSQGFVNNTGGVAQTTLTGSNNLQTVQTYDIAPVFRHHFGSYADSESRYRFGTTIVGGDSVAPVRTSDFTQKVTSGTYFGALNWTLTADATRSSRVSGGGTTDALAGTASNSDLLRADAVYPLYIGITGLSAIGGVGYERIKDNTLTQQPDGAIWDAGLQYAPNPRTSISATFGRRFDEPNYSFDGRYDLGPQTRISASYAESIQTSASLAQANLSFIVPNATGTGFVDKRTGLPFDPNSAFSINTSTFLDKRLSATATATRQRDNYVLTAFNETRKFDIPPQNEQIFGLTASWGRQLWPDLSSNLAVGYTHTDFGDGTGRVDDLYTFSGSLNYTLSPTATAQLSLSRTDRHSNASGGALTDDIVALLVSKHF